MPLVSVPTLTDGVVTLRAHREDDVAGCLEQCLDPVSRDWTTVPVPYAMDDARRFVREIMPGGWASDQEWGFAIDVDGRYAGTVSLRNEGEGRAEIAYGSHPWVRGTGQVERALRLLLDWGFSPESAGGRDLETVIWWANRGNWASRKVAWRLGFEIAEGAVRRWLPQRGELRDAWVGSLLRDDERAPRHPWLDAPTVLLDGGLRLRRLGEGDLPRVVEACRDAASQRWLPVPTPYESADAEAWLQESTLRAATGELLLWAVADEDDRLLGAVNLFDLGPRAHGGAEVGYWVHPDARGRGVALAGVRAAVRHGFIGTEDGGLGLRRIHAFAGVDNAPSLAVLRHAGFREVGRERGRLVIDGSPMDVLRFDLLATDPAATAG